MRLPAALLRHTVLVEAPLGEGGAGPLYAPPVPLRCLVDRGRESQRRGADRAPRDLTSIIAPIEARTVLVVDARVTLPDGERVEVQTVRVRDAPGLPVPEHVEASLI